MSFQITHIIVFNIISVLPSVLKCLQTENVALSHIRVSIRGSRQHEDCISGQARIAESALVMF